MAFCVATLKSAVAAVEQNGGVENLETLYSSVSKRYAAMAPDGFDVLSPQVIKARIEELVASNDLVLKTQPGRRGGSGQNVVSKKEVILDHLQNLDQMVVDLIESTVDEATKAILQKISDGFVEVADIVNSLHARKKTEESDSTETEVAPIEDTETVPAESVAA